MTDRDLRARIRESLDRHLASRAAAASDRGRDGCEDTCREHASHRVYLTLVNAGDACVIEPGVPCDHCGYCRSHGH